MELHLDYPPTIGVDIDYGNDPGYLHHSLHTLDLPFVHSFGFHGGEGVPEEDRYRYYLLRLAHNQVAAHQVPSIGFLE